jgi:hypothetical protein
MLVRTSTENVVKTWWGGDGWVAHAGHGLPNGAALRLNFCQGATNVQTNQTTLVSGS